MTEHEAGLLDTNLFVNAQMNNPHSSACRKLISGLEDGSVKGRLHLLVLHELSYALRNLLQWDRKQIADYLLSLVTAPGVQVMSNPDIVADGILRWRDGDSQVAFTDAILASEALASSSPVCSVNESDFTRVGASCVVPVLHNEALQLRQARKLPPASAKSPS